MLIDSHCHLDLITGSKDISTAAKVLANAQRNGVERILNISVDLESFATVHAAALRYAPQVFAAVGIHPNTPPKQQTTIAELVNLASQPRVIAIGETGLDYYRSEGDINWQKERFRLHIRAALEVGKPLIIHCRQAKLDVLEILRQERAAEVGGIMHCFSEDWTSAETAMDMGFYISFSGIVTFKNAVELKEIAQKIPAERLLIETDAPYLAPAPYRGKPNQPAYLRFIAEHLAQLRQESAAAIAETTSQNFFRLFKLSQNDE